MAITSKQAGIGMVELIVVATVFLGLAAVALPRFTALDEEARLQALSDLANEIRSQSELSHAIWRSAGQPKSLQHNGRSIDLIDGYPAVDAMSELLVGDTLFTYEGGRYYYAAGGKMLAECHVSYIPPQAAQTQPRINVVVDGC